MTAAVPAHRLDGRLALVTGAAGNIGGAIATCLAAAGADVVAHCRDDVEALQGLAGQVTASGRRCVTVAADLERPADIEAMFADLDEQGLAPDLVVNNAALQPVADFDSLSPDDWQALLTVNVAAPFRIVQLAARRMKSGGAVVNVASIEGSDPAPGHTHYAASKAALEMSTRAAALELGTQGIRVNTVSPGLIERPGLERDWPDGVARWRDKAPLSRLGTATDVAHAVLFLLSDEASWISGANLLVDGGMSAAPRW